MTDDRIERGTAEETGGAPPTKTEPEADRIPPGPAGPDDATDSQVAEEHDKAESAKNTDV